MSLKTGIRSAPRVVATLAVILAAATGAAAKGDHKGIAQHRGHSRYVGYHGSRFVGRRAPQIYGYTGRSPHPYWSGPGYVFVPGAGILREDCDMPTSTCTNEYRDVQ